MNATTPEQTISLEELVDLDAELICECDCHQDQRPKADHRVLLGPCRCTRLLCPSCTASLTEALQQIAASGAGALCFICDNVATEIRIHPL